MRCYQRKDRLISFKKLQWLQFQKLQMVGLINGGRRTMSLLKLFWEKRKVGGGWGGNVTGKKLPMCIIGKSAEPCCSMESKPYVGWTVNCLLNVFRKRIGYLIRKGKNNAIIINNWLQKPRQWVLRQGVIRSFKVYFIVIHLSRAT